ncbi:MAG: nitroreductase family protein [Clostridia bacterium]|nr:nitroreductase family protein [Clostridia bacterium]
MENIIIDALKCVGCGKCVKDCVAFALYLKDGKAKLREGCIECGHCYAICPAGAVDMPGYDKTGSVGVTPMTAVDSETLLQAIKSRRTVRQFLDVPVEPEKLEKILEAGRYAPTGANSQNVAYTVLADRQAEIERSCVKLFRTGAKAGALFSRTLRNAEIGDSFFFKGAPLVIVVSGHGSVNASLASAYMELTANSLGLGVLYSGFFCGCAALDPRIRSKLRLPKGHKAVTCMVIGYPDVEYRRIPPRKPLKLNVLSK